MISERYWWITRINGAIVHLQLVKIVICPWPDRYRVRSLWTGREYDAEPGDLLPLSAVVDPATQCGKCGVRRDSHKARHRFEEPSR